MFTVKIGDKCTV